MTVNILIRCLQLCFASLSIINFLNTVNIKHAQFYEMEVITLGIKEGDAFHSFDEIEKKVTESTKEKYVQFYKREARTIDAGSRKTKRYLNLALKYYQVEWACVHGGRQFKCRSNGIRQSKTLKNKDPCPARVRIKVSPNGNQLIVINVENKHNHKVCKNLFNELPQQRKLPLEVREDTKKLLGMKVNRHMLRDELERKLDKKITLKDLANLHSENKLCYNNDIKEACERIHSKFGADSHILIDNNNMFRGLMFCTRAMKSAMAAYPEFLCMDGTYKLLNIRAPVYLILNENGNGESIIVAVGILLCEDKESITWFLENFKKEHPNWNKTKTIMTDKDLVERKVISECLPGARLQICIFHALKIFQSEITCEKFKITSTEKSVILDYLQKLVYSKNDNEFFAIVEKIKSNICESVFNYLETNWLCIKDEWYLGAQHNNFLNTTNNRIESINAKLKQVISKHSTIGEFLEKLLTILKSLEKEQNSRLANLLNKRSATLFKSDSIEYNFQNILTPYSFLKMKKQFFYKSVRVLGNSDKFECYNSDKSSTSYWTTSDSCTCYFNMSMRLPCKHIFAVRNALKKDLFEESLIPERWKMTYLIENNTLLNENSYDYNEHNNSVEIVNENSKKKLSAQEKYRLLFTKCKLIASLGTEAQGENFHKTAKFLDDIINMLRYNIYDFEFSYKMDDDASKSLTLRDENYSENLIELNLQNINMSDTNEIIIEDFSVNSKPVEENSSENLTEDEVNNIEENREDERLYLPNINIGDTNEIVIEDFSGTQNTELLYACINLDSQYSQSNKNAEHNIENKENEVYSCDNYKEINIGEGDSNNLNHNIFINNDHAYFKSKDNNINFAHENSYTSNQLIEGIQKSSPNNEIDINNIIVIPSKVKGRPKGRDVTVIGLPKKKKKLKISFEDKSVVEKRDIILNWLLINTDVLKSKKSITMADFRSLNDIDVRILEVNVAIIKKIIPKDTWEIVKILKQNKKLSATWICPICKNMILSSESTVRCDACLHWHHVNCSNFTSTSRSTTWYCNSCN